ncbi:potassium channel family protein [Catellatospora methionotrophica]|uniref:potassium channel family protein n=1 Tax=Catellatospora methionotrophica TaxID=121620 RepID=UPI0033D7F9B6
MKATEEGSAAAIPARGQPRTAAAAAALARYDRRARLPIILSAVLPLIIAPQQGNWVAVLIGVVSWLVFAVDFFVHERLLVNFLGTKVGKFDLAIVVLTAPWFLIAGAHAGGFVVILRLARLSRLLIATKGVKRLFARLGRVTIIAAAVLFVGGTMAYFAEHPTNPEFATFGDAIWWATVTLTTVGYGDIVPITTAGRIDATFIMFMGVALLGLLAGSLANFFGLQSQDNGPPQPNPNDPVLAAQAEPHQPATANEAVLAELADLRAEVRQLADLREQLAVISRHLTKIDEPGAG